MKAAPGDRLILRPIQGGTPVRDAEVIEAQGSRGGPPFLVRWSDTGHEALIFPGPGAVVHHRAKRQPK